MLKHLDPDEVYAHFAMHEGVKDWIYLDTVGLPTVGIGCQIFKPFFPENYGGWTINGMPASRAEVMTDFNTVQNVGQRPEPPFFTAEAYRDRCRTRLTEASISKLLQKRLGQTESELTAHFGAYESMPPSVSFALLDMGFNMGVGKLMAGFPKFNAAIRSGDYVTAANESAREPGKAAWDERNEWTRKTLLSAAGVAS